MKRAPKTEYGVLAQLVERKVRNLEARGSIPLCSTIKDHTFVNNDKSVVLSYFRASVQKHSKISVNRGSGAVNATAPRHFLL